MENKKKYVYENHSNDVLNRMSLDRTDKSLCDVELIVGNRRFVFSAPWPNSVVLIPESLQICGSSSGLDCLQRVFCQDVCDRPEGESEQGN